MTYTIRAHFDGETLVPDEPVELPVDQPLTLTVQLADGSTVNGRAAILADPNKTLEEKLAAIERTFSHGVEGVNLPAEALRRENMYGDDGR